MCKVHKALHETWKYMEDADKLPYEQESQRTKAVFDDYMTRMGPASRYWGSNINVAKP